MSLFPRPALNTLAPFPAKPDPFPLGPVSLPLPLFPCIADGRMVPLGGAGLGGLAALLVPALPVPLPPAPAVGDGSSFGSVVKRFDVCHSSPRSRSTWDEAREERLRARRPRGVNECERERGRDEDASMGYQLSTLHAHVLSTGPCYEYWVERLGGQG